MGTCLDFNQSIFSCINKSMVKYDRLKAIEYAYNFWNKRNPRFYNFDKIGGDCTNFISQCLFYGGIEMSFSKNGWYYSSLNNRAPAWTGVDEFYDFLITNTSKFGVKGKLIDLSQVEVGDVIQMDQRRGYFHHNLIVTSIGKKKNPQNIFIACHSADAFNKRLADYNYSRLRVIKILN